MLTGSDKRVVNFYNYFQGLPKDSEGLTLGNGKSSTGYRFVTGGPNPSIQLRLPSNLLDYANASSGHMPDGMGGTRPVGIRAGRFKSPEDAANAIRKIFSSPDTLAAFISKSEADAVQGKAPPPAPTQGWRDLTSSLGIKGSQIPSIMPGDPEKNKALILSLGTKSASDAKAVLAAHGVDLDDPATVAKIKSAPSMSESLEQRINEAQQQLDRIRQLIKY